MEEEEERLIKKLKDIIKSKEQKLEQQRTEKEAKEKEIAANTTIQDQLDKLNYIEEKELGSPLKRKWTIQEHILFLEAYHLFQKLPVPQKISKMAQFVQSRCREEIELRCNIYEFHYRIPKEKANTAVNYFEFTNADWSEDEQNLLTKENRAWENSGKYCSNGSGPDAQNILQNYFLIASKLENKTVRDVAFRLRWMKENEALSSRNRDDTSISSSNLGKRALPNSVKDQSQIQHPNKKQTINHNYANATSSSSSFAEQCNMLNEILNDNDGLLHEIEHNLQKNKVIENVALMKEFYRNSHQVPMILQITQQNQMKQQGWNQMLKLPANFKTYPPECKDRLPEELLQSTKPKYARRFAFDSGTRGPADS